MSTTERDLSGIKHILTARCSALRQRHERIKNDLQRRTDPDVTLHVIDDATQDELATIEVALRRLDQGLYGICGKCGGDIEAIRLQALHAVTCSKCATN